MIRTALFIGLPLVLLGSSLAEASVIGSRTSSAVPTVSTFNASSAGELTSGGGDGRSVTIDMTMSSINRAQRPANTGTANYIVVDPNDGDPPGNDTVSFTLNVTHSDAAQPLMDVVVTIVNAYQGSVVGAPGVTFLAVTGTPAPFSVQPASTLPTSAETIWMAVPNTGAGPGTYTFNFDLSVDRPTANGAGFSLLVTARNPEPGSMALAAVAMTMLGGGAAQRRRKKNQQNQTKADVGPEALAI